MLTPELRKKRRTYYVSARDTEVTMPAIIAAISKEYPDVIFEHAWYDFDSDCIQVACYHPDFTIVPDGEKACRFPMYKLLHG